LEDNQAGLMLGVDDWNEINPNGLRETTPAVEIDESL